MKDRQQAKNEKMQIKGNCWAWNGFVYGDFAFADFALINMIFLLDFWFSNIKHNYFESYLKYETNITCTTVCGKKRKEKSLLSFLSISSHLMISFTNFLWNAFTSGFSWKNKVSSFKHTTGIFNFINDMSLNSIISLYKALRKYLFHW